MTTSENIQSTLSELVEPLRDQLEALDAEIERAEVQLAFMRQTRRNVTRALSYIDPTFVTTVDSTAKKQKSKKQIIRSTSRTPDIRDWIVARQEVISENGGFSAATLIREYGFDMVSQSTLNKALLTLHEEGLLRIDHRGFGGSRYYKVVG
jgi:hypothetical protein